METLVGRVSALVANIIGRCILCVCSLRGRRLNRKERQFGRETADEREESSNNKKKNRKGKITNSILLVCIMAKEKNVAN